MKTKVKIRKPVFITMALFYIIAILAGVISPDTFSAVQAAIVDFSCYWFGWLYHAVILAMVIMCLWIIFSKRAGGIRLGGQNAKPIMSKWNWFAITLCGGIATGIVFWGIAEPVTHFMDPIPNMGYEALTHEGATMALSTCYLHWAFTQYSAFTIAGVAIGLATYNLKLPYRISSALYPIFGKKVMGGIGTVVDLLCLFGLAGGVSSSLGECALQIGAGLGILDIVQPSAMVWLVILVTVVIAFLLSSYTGIGKGVRFLSDCNAKIYIGMLIFIVIVGPTRLILSLTFESLGVHTSEFFHQMTYLGAYNNEQWSTWWTLNYWCWTIAYMFLLGMFFAKIARGRTLREFVSINMLLPGAFNVIWFGVFGSAAIDIERSVGGLWDAMNELGTEASVFLFFEHFPLSKIMSVIFLITVFLSVVTLADSMTTTISSLSIVQNDASTTEPPAKIKIFWGLAISSLSLVNIITAAIVGNVSSIDAVKSLAIVSAFPLLFLAVILIVSTVKMIVQYDKYDTVDHPETSVVDPECIVDIDIAEA